MSDRKYRQRGYQDEPKGPRGPKPEKPAPERTPGRVLQDARGPKTPNLMASHEVFKCARCGNKLAIPEGLDAIVARCSRCGVDVRCCINCVSFDTSARFECAETTLTARISPKDTQNACPLFAPRTTVERQTGTPAGPPSARDAFDKLFE